MAEVEEARPKPARHQERGDADGVGDEQPVRPCKKQKVWRATGHRCEGAHGQDHRHEVVQGQGRHPHGHDFHSDDAHGQCH
eukprot:15446085-Alexandrium_andersonii.AAC.1